MEKSTITKLGVAISGKSVKRITENDLVEIKKYQQGLIDFLLYETTAKDNKKGIQERLIAEIRRCEVWLKDQYKDFMNSKIKFEAA